MLRGLELGPANRDMVQQVTFPTAIESTRARKITHGGRVRACNIARKPI